MKHTSNKLGKITSGKVKKDKRFVVLVMQAAEVSHTTSVRWIKENHENLTKPSCLEMICKELKITQKEALA